MSDPVSASGTLAVPRGRILRKLLAVLILGSLIAWPLYGAWGWKLAQALHATTRSPLPPDTYRLLCDQQFIQWNAVLLLCLVCSFFLTQWRLLSRLTQYLAVFAIVNVGVAAAVLLGPLRVPLGDTSLRPTSHVLLGWEGDDSWRPMLQAHAFVQDHPTEPLYTKFFFEQRTKYQYPPSALLVCGVLRWLAPWHVYEHQYYLFGVAEWFSWVFFLVLMVYAGKILRWSARRFGVDAHPPFGVDRFARILLVLFFALTFYPATSAYDNGQIQTWINGLFALMAWNWIVGHRGTAGVLAGTMALLKPQYGFLLLWGMLRGQRTFIQWGLATILAGLGASVWLHGLDTHADYLKVLSFLSQHGEAYYPNQSFNGLLNRWFATADSLHFDFHGFPPFHPGVYAGTIASAVLLLLAACRPPKHGRGGAEDLAVAALSATIATPIAWPHQYGILLVIYALLLPAVLARRTSGGPAIALLTASYVLTSHYLIMTNRWVRGPGWTTLGQSYLLFGALIVFGLCYWLRATASKGGQT